MAAEQRSVSKAEKHGDKLQSHTIQCMSSVPLYRTPVTILYSSFKLVIYNSFQFCLCFM